MLGVCGTIFPKVLFPKVFANIPKTQFSEEQANKR